MFEISNKIRILRSNLKDENRQSISALIIAGGWIEGLFIATQVAKGTNNPEIITRIGEQKLSLNNVINLIESYPADEMTSPVLDYLKDLKKVFDNVQFSKSALEIKTYPEKKMTTISGNGTVSVSKEQLQEISDKVELIRNNIIK